MDWGVIATQFTEFAKTVLEFIQGAEFANIFNELIETIAEILKNI